MRRSRRRWGRRRLVRRRQVRLFDPAGAGNTVVTAQASKPIAISISPDGRLLAMGCEDGRVILGTVEGRTTDRAKRRQGPVRQLAFASSSRLVVGHDDGIRLYPGQPGVVPRRGNRSFLRMRRRKAGGFAATAAFWRVRQGYRRDFRFGASTATRAGKPIVADPKAGVLDSGVFQRQPSPRDR